MIRCFTFLLVTLFCISACSSCAPAQPTNSSSYDNNNVVSNQPVDLEKMDVLEETDFYRIKASESLYYFELLDNNDSIVLFDGPFSKLPKINMLEKGLVKVSVQAGLGNGTRWSFFYDINKDAFSRVFYCVYAQENGLVAYGEKGKVVVRDIFDKSNYYEEFAEFSLPFSSVAEPILNVEFINASTGIMVTYFTGDLFEKTTEKFVLSMS